jgi:hypothetical protein
MSRASNRPTWLLAVAGAVGLFIAVNVVLSVVALVAKLPDTPHTHATTDHITVGTVLWGNGSIISPPLYFMVVVGLLLWGVLARRKWLSIVSAVLLVVGTVVMAIDEFGGDGGLTKRPVIYSQSKWDLAQVLGWIFIVAAVGVVVSAAGWLATSARRAEPATG